MARPPQRRKGQLIAGAAELSWIRVCSRGPCSPARLNTGSSFTQALLVVLCLLSLSNVLYCIFIFEVI